MLTLLGFCPFVCRFGDSTSSEAMPREKNPKARMMKGRILKERILVVVRVGLDP
jgi:hypothetical protein